MFKKENFQNQARGEKFWIYFVFLLIAVFAFHGKTVPFSNEFVYLLRLEPNFLQHDWTFSKAASEHWLFNRLFSFPARFLSIETIGWTGRIVVWCLSLVALLRIGKHWEIPNLSVAVSVFVWLAFGQSIVADEWIFGGFEAKAAAYVCLLFALEKFCRRETILPSVLLGLVFSFHPAVGFWAILAVGLALLFEKVSVKDFLRVVILTAVFALPGIISALYEQSGASANSFEDWRFIVTVRAPTILDPFRFPLTGVLLLFAMLAFNVLVLRKNESFALRFLLKFQIAVGAFFLFGVLLRRLELFPFLRLMPMRLFPVFTPLFFVFTAFYIFPRLENVKHKALICLFVILNAIWINPFLKGFMQARETIENQTAAPDDLQKSFVWIAKNTPADAVIIAPPQRRDVWYFSRRATVTSFAYPTYDRLSEWRERLSDLTDDAKISGGEFTGEEIERAFNNLSAEDVSALREKYRAAFLVSRAVYSYPIVLETETYRVYQLP